MKGYLSRIIRPVHDISIEDAETARHEPIASHQKENAVDVAKGAPIEKEDDYVYDVFYFHKKDDLGIGLSRAANIGLVCVWFYYCSQFAQSCSPPFQILRMINPEDDVEFLAHSDDDEDSIPDDDDPDSNG